MNGIVWQNSLKYELNEKNTNFLFTAFFLVDSHVLAWRDDLLDIYLLNWVVGFAFVSYFISQKEFIEQDGNNNLLLFQMEVAKLIFFFLVHAPKRTKVGRGKNENVTRAIQANSAIHESVVKRKSFHAQSRTKYPIVNTQHSSFWLYGSRILMTHKIEWKLNKFERKNSYGYGHSVLSNQTSEILLKLNYSH